VGQVLARKSPPRREEEACCWPDPSAGLPSAEHKKKQSKNSLTTSRYSPEFAD